MDTETALKQFVAGQIGPKEFEQLLYADPDRFESYLDNDPNLSAANDVNGSVFQCLLYCNYDTIGGVLDAQGAIADYFERNGIACERDTTASNLYDMLLEVQPDYVGVDPEWLIEHYSKYREWSDVDARRAWLKVRVREDFRYVKNPPEWIQSPAWPVGRDGPMIFMGQIEVEDFFHDEAAIYIFYDPATGCCESIIQVA